MKGDLKVYLEGGTYRLNDPLLLDERDSGMNGHYVSYTAVTGQKVVISGAVQITRWKILDAKRNLWSAPAPAELRNTRQLYVNGVRAFRTRGRVPIELRQTETGYTADSHLMSHWKNPQDIEFVYTGGNTIWSEPSEGLGAWTEPRCPIASVNGTAITMARPCWDNSTKRVMLPNGARTANLVGPKSVGKQPAYVENAFELLGTPGQWYFDRSARVIYYVPRHGEDLKHADVEVPVLGTLISGQGTAANPIHNIRFSGIQFSYATWLFPSTPEGFSEIQANYMVTGPDGYAKQGLCDLVPGGTCPYGNWTKAPGNISFQYDRGIEFVNDALVHLGAAGLDLGDGSQRALVEGCIFTDISGNGLELGGVDQPLAALGEQTSDDRIVNDHIYNIGAEFRGAVGIVVGYAKNVRILHNQLDHLPYAGISMGWGGWPDKIQKPGLTNYSQNNLVANNSIYDYMLVLADGGAIYTQGLTGMRLEGGERVSGNVVRDQFGTGHGIYTDNGSSNITVDDNVIFNTNFDNWGSRHKDYYNGQNGADFDPLLIKGNYWEQGDPDSSRGNVTETGNKLIDSMSQASHSLTENAGIELKYRWILKQKLAPNSTPEQPSRVAAASGNHFAYVTWSPPVFDGGSTVQEYVITGSGSLQATISAAEFAKKAYIKISGLATGHEYKFQVAARNESGLSEASLPSLPIRVTDQPAAPPGRPAKIEVLPGRGMASIHFQAPANGHENAPVLGYILTIDPGARKVVFEGRRAITLEGRHTTFYVVDGLESGKTYTFSIAAMTPDAVGAAATTGPVKIQ